ncbi:pseudouridine-5'-phosphate glycosidase [Pelagibacterium lacus]|uniref:Pseudouridine-5'-phosphate glycosidase n=1 Tax=Pelagibacterium lacus TaxID=2282655 RepID=A0A369W587_9HYPH|nr:pseudouridine-5'-phosphate glycosidase [Pelagibacterium lacus]RDE09025.1 pseudouridine-5'-phosphate glycosidase [Pelagibacterium lacus]
MSDFLDISPEIKYAIADRQPVVALESTIITHGMPYPQNLETALAVEQVVRDNGAVPATIAVIDGQCHVGVEGDRLEVLARTGLAAAKASRRDLAAIIVKKLTAGTTVATTMQLAHKAGIKMFATGGIGGVHRGAETTFDVSADLVELSQTPVTVVCAGAKSILDIAKTLEVLETYGVPVIGYGTETFPAFFARESGHGVDYRLDTPEEVAALIAMQRVLEMRSGVLVANPIPEADALDAEEIDARIAGAIADAEAAGVGRKDVTPYLLNRIFELTDGRSLAANIALVKNNAAVAAKIAAALERRG